MEFTRDWLGRYLTHRLGAPMIGEDIVKFGRGTSRETWFARYRPAPGGDAVNVVLRADHPGGSVDPTPLDQEYFVYERLGAADLPVARVLWWEDDRAWTSRPFYVREKIEGDWRPTGYFDAGADNRDLRMAIAKEHIGALARIHAVDWRGLGFGARLAVPDGVADAARAYIATAQKRMAETPGEAMPVFLEACEWLHDHAPTASRLCLCKGTNGLGEEVFRDGKLVALSDWEEVWIGDPAADFAFMQGFLDPIERDGVPIWGLQQALDHYHVVSGCEIAIESVRYYQVIRALTMLVMCRNSATIVHESRGEATIRHCWTATEVLHVSKAVLATSMGWLAPFPAERYGELNQTVDAG